MTLRTRVWVLMITGTALLAGAAAYGGVAWFAHQAQAAGPSSVRTVTATVPSGGDRVVFRNTASGTGYGEVASVPLAEPAGARALTGLACDRVYATTRNEMCLHIDRGVVTRFTATLLDASGHEVRSWPLPGIPSRTRISPDSRLVATTAFITGESYASVTFATQTVISTVDGTQYGNLEDFALTAAGERVTAADRNIWGVTFSSDDNVFFATAASGRRTWLVRGDLEKRTLTAVADSAECPSLSPDGQRVAYKKDVSTTATPYWTIAVLDFATGQETLLPEKNNVDDQVEWLDDATLLYGLPRTDAAGDSDIWSLSADGTSNPRVLIEHAWSPSVVRE
jgi:WD40 repeat protein